MRNCKICSLQGPFHKSVSNFPIFFKRPLERIQADLCNICDELNIRVKGNIYLMLVIDHFTKFVFGRIIPNKNMETTTSKLNEYISIYIFKKPCSFQTDHGGEFRNSSIETFCKNNDIRFIMGRVKHPQSQGAVERVVQTIHKAY